MANIDFYRRKVMDYTIYPFEGVGPIKFGMTPEQVHAVVGEPENSLIIHEGEFPTDTYYSQGFRIEYTAAGVCDEIWLFPEECNPILQGYGLAGQTFRELKEWFQKLGTPVEHYSCGMTFLKFGIYIYASYYTYYDGNVDDPVELIAVCSSSNIERLLASKDDNEFPTEEAISVG
jgi:hypothetical protein